MVIATTLDLEMTGCPFNYYNPQGVLWFQATYINPEYGTPFPAPWSLYTVTIRRPDNTIYTFSQGPPNAGITDRTVFNQPGAYTITAHYPGASGYAPCDATITCSVNQPNPNTQMTTPVVEVNPIIAGATEYVWGTVLDGEGWAENYQNGGRVHFYLVLNGVVMDIGGADAWSSTGGWYDKLFNAPTTPGNYILRITFSGDAYLNNAQVEVPLTVNPGQIVKQNVFMVGYPQDPSGLVLPGGQVQLGVGVYVGDTGNVPPNAYPPGDLTAIHGAVPVKVYLTEPNSGGGSFLYKTVTVNSGVLWLEGYSPTVVGLWHVTYVFDGNAEYNSRQQTLDWTVAQCNADIYEDCPDGTQIMTYDCINGVSVPTDEVCPSLPTEMTCDAVDSGGNGATGRVGNKFYVSAHMTGTVYGTPNQPLANFPINVYIRRPSDSNLTNWTVLTTGNAGNVQTEYTPNQVGTYYFRFEFTGGMVNGIFYGPSGCDAVFDVVPCYSGEVLATRRCPDGSVINILTCVDNQPYETGNFCPGTECRDAHPSMECQNGNEWDCAQNVWVDIQQPCGECLTAHPAGYDCINGKIWACVHPGMVGGILPPPEWVNTGVDCCDQDQVQICADGSTVVLKECIDDHLYPTGLSCNGPQIDPMLLLGGGIAVAGLAALLLLGGKKKK
jgi:hypothetical protein